MAGSAIKIEARNAGRVLALVRTLMLLSIEGLDVLDMLVSPGGLPHALNVLNIGLSRYLGFVSVPLAYSCFVGLSRFIDPFLIAISATSTSSLCRSLTLHLVQKAPNLLKHSPLRGGCKLVVACGKSPHRLL